MDFTALDALINSKIADEDLDDIGLTRGTTMPDGMYRKYGEWFYFEIGTELPSKDALAEKAEAMNEVLPPCPDCGKKLTIHGICNGCDDGKDGYKSKYVCSCGYTNKFKISVQDKLEELKGSNAS